MDRYWLQITSGRGPAECELLAAKVLACMLAEAQKTGVDIQVHSKEHGDAKNIYKSVVMLCSDPTGLFYKKWVGTIQWQWQSAFRPKHKRKNWFISVNKLEYTEYNDQLLDKDVRIETMSGIGPGGQNVNKLALAVRMTHIPTGISAVGRDERSLDRNKQLAKQRLQEKISLKKELEMKKFDKSVWQLHEQVERGSPVRVFHGDNFKEKP